MYYLLKCIKFSVKENKTVKIMLEKSGKSQKTLSVELIECPLNYGVVEHRPILRPIKNDLYRIVLI